MTQWEATQETLKEANRALAISENDFLDALCVLEGSGLEDDKVLEPLVDKAEDIYVSIIALRNKVLEQIG